MIIPDNGNNNFLGIEDGSYFSWHAQVIENIHKQPLPVADEVLQVQQACNLNEPLSDRSLSSASTRTSPSPMTVMPTYPQRPTLTTTSVRPSPMPPPSTSSTTMMESWPCFPTLQKGAMLQGMPNGDTFTSFTKAWLEETMEVPVPGSEEFKTTIPAEKDSFTATYKTTIISLEMDYG